VEQELPTLPEDLSSPLVFSGVRVAQSLVLCVCFVNRCLSSVLHKMGLESFELFHILFMLNNVFV
jgi:hypothetical protein